MNHQSANGVSHLFFFFEHAAAGSFGDERYSLVVFFFLCVFSMRQVDRPPQTGPAPGPQPLRSLCCREQQVSLQSRFSQNESDVFLKF